MRASSQLESAGGETNGSVDMMAAITASSHVCCSHPIIAILTLPSEYGKGPSFSSSIAKESMIQSLFCRCRASTEDLCSPTHCKSRGSFAVFFLLFIPFFIFGFFIFEINSECFSVNGKLVGNQLIRNMMRTDYVNIAPDVNCEQRKSHLYPASNAHSYGLVRLFKERQSYKCLRIVNPYFQKDLR